MRPLATPVWIHDQVIDHASRAPERHPVVAFYPRVAVADDSAILLGNQYGDLTTLQLTWVLSEDGPRL